VTFLNILRNAQTKRSTPVVIVTRCRNRSSTAGFATAVQGFCQDAELFDELMQWCTASWRWATAARRRNQRFRGRVLAQFISAKDGGRADILILLVALLARAFCLRGNFLRV